MGRLWADVACAPGAIARMERLGHTGKASGCSYKGPALQWSLTLLLAPHHFLCLMLDRTLPLSELQIPISVKRALIPAWLGGHFQAGDPT